MKRIQIVLCSLLMAFLAVGCGNQDDEASKYQTMIPAQTYTYYAVSPDEAEITLDMEFFCPASISKTDLAETAFTLGNSGAIRVVKSEIMSTADIEEADYYLAQVLLTLDVETMAADILSFHSLTYTVPGKDPQFLHLGPTIIDRHFAADQNAEILSIEEQNSIVTPTTQVTEYRGYPDNPNYYFDLWEIYPEIMFYQVRPVWQYTVDGQLYYTFQQKDDGMLQQIDVSSVPQEGGLKSTLKAFQDAYAPYKEAYDAGQAGRDTNPDPPSYDRFIIR